jgi:hypothetical protein
MTRVNTVIHNMLRRIGKDHLARRFVGGSYEDSIVIGDYKVDFDEQENDDIIFIIRNPITPCVVVYIHKEEAMLESLDYSPLCNIQGNMLHGSGTRKMIRFALELAKGLGAKTIQLQDESHITCETGEKIKLGPFSFFKTGQTWYEKHFGFYPTAEYQDEYEEAKELRKTLDIQDKPCIYFDRKTTDKLLRDVHLSFFRIVWEKSLV